MKNSILKVNKYRYRTNCELLNALFGTSYRGYQFSVYRLNDDCYVWMVEFDGENNGWHNKKDGDTIIERRKEYSRHWVFQAGLNYKYRLVFEKCKDKAGHYFYFHGVFKTLKISDDKLERTLIKVQDEINLKDLKF